MTHRKLSDGPIRAKPKPLSAESEAGWRRAEAWPIHLQDLLADIWATLDGVRADLAAQTKRAEEAESKLSTERECNLANTAEFLREALETMAADGCQLQLRNQDEPRARCRLCNGCIASAAIAAVAGKGVTRTFAIQSAKRSPMNAELWLLVLECGHEQWVTQKTRPRRRMQCRVAACALGLGACAGKEET